MYFLYIVFSHVLIISTVPSPTLSRLTLTPSYQLCTFYPVFTINDSLSCQNILHVWPSTKAWLTYYREKWPSHSQQLGNSNNSLSTHEISCASPSFVLGFELLWACLCPGCDVTLTANLYVYISCWDHICFLVVFYHLWLFHSFHLLFRGCMVVYVFHLKMDILKSFICCTLGCYWSLYKSSCTINRSFSDWSWEMP